MGETQVEHTHTQYELRSLYGVAVAAWGIHDHKRSLMQIGPWPSLV